MEKESEDPKAEGGEKEAFDELPKIVEDHIGKMHPGYKLHEENTFYVDSIAVLPDFQRKGIGTNLLKRLLSEAREEKYDVLVVHAMVAHKTVDHKRVETGSAIMFERALGADAKVKDYDCWYSGDKKGTGETARLFAAETATLQKHLEKNLRRV
jgi:GNAT superfamily N-acetyltransferase